MGCQNAVIDILYDVIQRRKHLKGCMKTEMRAVLLKGLDEHLPTMRTFPVPARGWLRAVRDALGLSQRQVAKKLGMRQQPYAAMEEREKGGTVTLETLERAAGALDCDLVYYLVPKPGLAQTFTELAAKHDPAQAHRRATEHSMALEGQGAVKSKQPRRGQGAP